MTLDEVIAHNLRRIREAKEISVAHLASRMEVSRHTMYSFEGRRSGAQRQFLWSDLVRLCDILGVTLFELVLPPAGTHIDELTVDSETASAFAAKFPSAGEGDAAAELSRDGRSVLGIMLFGIEGRLIDSKAIENANAARRTDEERVHHILAPILEDVLRATIPRVLGREEEE